MFERRSLKGCPVTQATRREKLEIRVRAVCSKLDLTVGLYSFPWTTGGCYKALVAHIM
jgi:hypothetical protein